MFKIIFNRQLPGLKHLRKSIEFTQRWLWVQNRDAEESGEHLDGSVKAAYEQSKKEMAEQKPFQEARLAYWQTNYDFTMGLLLEGYKPYSFQEILPYVEEYAVSLLAVNPELSPTNLTAEIPDVQANIKKMLQDLKMRDKREEN